MSGWLFVQLFCFVFTFYINNNRFMSFLILGVRKLVFRCLFASLFLRLSGIFLFSKKGHATCQKRLQFNKDA